LTRTAPTDWSSGDQPVSILLGRAERDLRAQLNASATVQRMTCFDFRPHHVPVVRVLVAGTWHHGDLKAYDRRGVGV
jgi:hypothetical protein